MTSSRLPYPRPHRTRRVCRGAVLSYSANSGGVRRTRRSSIEHPEFVKDEPAEYLVLPEGLRAPVMISEEGNRNRLQPFVTAFRASEDPDTTAPVLVKAGECQSRRGACMFRDECIFHSCIHNPFQSFLRFFVWREIVSLDFGISPDMRTSRIRSEDPKQEKTGVNRNIPAFFDLPNPPGMIQDIPVLFKRQH